MPSLHADASQLYHVLVEGSLALAPPQGEDGGGRQRAQVPQGQGRPPATQLQTQHTLDEQPPPGQNNHGPRGAGPISFLPSSPSRWPGS